jgi:hypothetical protein
MLLIGRAHVVDEDRKRVRPASPFLSGYGSFS